MSNRSPFAQMRRVYERGRRSRGLVVDRDGVALGPDVVLVRHSAAGYRCARTDDLVRLTRLVFTGDAGFQRLPAVLAQIARALDAGDLVKAQLLGLEIPIGELDDSQLARLAGAADLVKVGFDPSQPRDEGGRWTSEGGGDGAGADAAGVTPVQIADASEGISDAGGILPRQPAANGASNETGTPAAMAATIPPAPPGAGKVREYSPADAAKLPPPPPGSKYITLNDGSVLWDGYVNGGHGGPMLMPKEVSLEDNVEMGQSLAGFSQVSPSVDAGVSPRESAMAYLFLPGYGPMDYQSAYGTGDQYNRNYVDFTNYNYGVVAAAAGYSRDEALANAGMANQAKDWWDRHRHGAPPKDMSGPFKNKVQNADMIMRGYDDYRTGRIVAPHR